jgi:hypothetical protein
MISNLIHCGMGLVKFIYLLLFYFGGKCLAFGAIIFKEKFQNFSFNFFLKIKKKITMFLHIVQVSSQDIKGF